MRVPEHCAVLRDTLELRSEICTFLMLDCNFVNTSLFSNITLGHRTVFRKHLKVILDYLTFCFVIHRKLRMEIPEFILVHLTLRNPC